MSSARTERGASFSVGREHGNSLWQQDRVRPVRKVLMPALPTQPERVSVAADKGWVLKWGSGEHSQAEDCCGLWGDIVRGWGWEELYKLECLWRKPEATREQGNLCWLMPKGRPTIAAPLPLCWPLLSQHYEGPPPRWTLLSSSHSLPPCTSSTISRLQANWGSFWSRHLWVAHTHRRSWKLS